MAEQLKSTLLANYTLENLNWITSKIIGYNKCKQTACLIKMGELVSQYVPFDNTNTRKLFSQLIMLYHPDKLAEYHKLINTASNKLALQAFAHIDPMLTLVNSLDKEGITPFYTPDEFEQEFGWNYENTADDYYIARDDDDTVNHMYRDDYQEEYDYSETVDVLTKGSFLEAVKRKIYGSMLINFPVHQLEDMEEIEMSEYEIEGLDGIEYCSYVKILDLSYNSISDITSLEHCEYLQELYLQNNQISNIDILYCLPDLRVIDLANNQISDVSVLFELKCLEFVNLLGNPVPKQQITRLTKIGIVVVS